MPIHGLRAQQSQQSLRCVARCAGDIPSRGPSNTGEFALPSTTLSSSPGQFGTVEIPAPYSVCSNPPSLPASNPPTSNPPSELHEEDDLAQATIGHSIAQAASSMHTTAAAMSAATAAGSPDAAATGVAAVAADAAALQQARPGAVVAVTTSVTVTAPLPVAGSAMATGDQALPPTEVNIARHTHALAATVMPAPQQQKVGRFSVKKKHDHTTSDNGSAVTMPGMHAGWTLYTEGFGHGGRRSCALVMMPCGAGHGGARVASVA